MREMHMWTRGGPSRPPMPLHAGWPGRRPASGDFHPGERFERSAIPKGRSGHHRPEPRPDGIAAFASRLRVASGSWHEIVPHVGTQRSSRSTDNYPDRAHP